MSGEVDQCRVVDVHSVAAVDANGAARSLQILQGGCSANLRKDTERVDVVADGVVRIWTRSMLSAVDATGALILAALFDGRPELTHLRGPRGRSLTALSAALEQRGMILSPRRLRCMVHQHLLLRGLPAKRRVSTLTHVAPSHLEEVAAWPEEKRIELVLEVEDRRLTVADLRARRHAELSSQDTAAPGDLLSTSAVVPSASDSVFHALEALEGHEDRLGELAQQLRGAPMRDRVIRIRVLGLILRLKELIEAIETSAQSAARSDVSRGK